MSEDKLIEDLKDKLKMIIDVYDEVSNEYIISVEEIKLELDKIEEYRNRVQEIISEINKGADVLGKILSLHDFLKEFNSKYHEFEEALKKIKRREVLENLTFKEDVKNDFIITIKQISNLTKELIQLCINLENNIERSSSIPSVFTGREGKNLDIIKSKISEVEVILPKTTRVAI
jgi:undecaprenyl pyrophosphate synthase